MKKYLLLYILILTNIALCISQDRINKELPIISPLVYSKLSTGKGWMLQQDGQWLGIDNFISKDNISLSLRKLLDNSDSRFCLDNFINYEIRELRYEDKDYLILIKQELNGQYKYNTIKEDWIESCIFRYVVFEKEELYSKLSNNKREGINRIELTPSFSPGYVLVFNEKNIDEIHHKIASQFIIDQNKMKEDFNMMEKQNDYIKNKYSNRIQNLPLSKMYSYHFVLDFTPNIQNDSIKFMMYGYKYDPNTKLKFPFFLNNNPIIEGDTPPYFGTNKMFEHCYYETSQSDFNNFIYKP